MGHLRIPTILLLLAAVLAAACGGGGGDTPRTPEGADATPTAEQRPSAAAPRTLASGEFQLPAACAFGDPGFHEALTADPQLPADLGSTSGLILVLELRDAGRPDVTCSRNHPLSGCATVDWSDAESRPKVPPGGVFDNSLTVELVSGSMTFYLSESDTLNDEPNPFSPG